MRRQHQTLLQKNKNVSQSAQLFWHEKINYLTLGLLSPGGEMSRIFIIQFLLYCNNCLF